MTFSGVDILYKKDNDNFEMSTESQVLKTTEKKAQVKTETRTIYNK